MNLILILYTLLINVILLLNKNYVLTSLPAGVYVDNGYDQTSIERYMTKQEKREMELEILNLLGLPNKPRRFANGTLKKSAPRFLMDVYKKLMEEEHGGSSNSRSERSVDLDLSGDEMNAIDQSDVIMTFESISHHVSSVRHERGKRLWFNVSEISTSEDILGAELRIYQHSNYTVRRPNAIYTVAAYQLINTEDGERELEFVKSVNTTASYSGWLELNITECLPSWVAFPESNKGLYLSVHPADKPAHEIRPEDIGLITIKGDEENQPFMVAFLKATNHIKAKKRRRRDVERGRKFDYTTVMKNQHQGNNVPHHEWRSCRIHTLYISFKDLEWQDWIVAPDGYAAYYCDGECNFPLNSHMNATNHAIVQTLVHLMNQIKYPKPCCAPTKLNPVSVLYYLDDTIVTLKKYKKMVVKSCGCL